MTADASSLAEAKRAARRAALEQRARAARAAGPGAARRAAGHLLAAIAELRGTSVVSAYLAMRDELDPMPAMLALHGLGFRIALPVVEGRGTPLRFRAWRPGAPTVPGPFGTRVPEAGDWLRPNMVIVPMLAVDPSGNRLGYGGGFYDRTLAGLRAEGPVHAVGLAYAGQEVADLPLEATDQPLDAIATETGLRRFG